MDARHAENKSLNEDINMPVRYIQRLSMSNSEINAIDITKMLKTNNMI